MLLSNKSEIFLNLLLLKEFWLQYSLAKHSWNQKLSHQSLISLQAGNITFSWQKQWNQQRLCQIFQTPQLTSSQREFWWTKKIGLWILKSEHFSSRNTFYLTRHQSFSLRIQLQNLRSGNQETHSPWDRIRSPKQPARTIVCGESHTMDRRRDLIRCLTI